MSPNPSKFQIKNNSLAEQLEHPKRAFKEADDRKQNETKEACHWGRHGPPQSDRFTTNQTLTDRSQQQPLCQHIVLRIFPKHSCKNQIPPTFYAFVIWETRLNYLYSICRPDFREWYVRYKEQNTDLYNTLFDGAKKREAAFCLLVSATRSSFVFGDQHESHLFGVSVMTYVNNKSSFKFVFYSLLLFKVDPWAGELARTTTFTNTLFFQGLKIELNISS